MKENGLCFVMVVIAGVPVSEFTALKESYSRAVEHKLNGSCCNQIGCILCLQIESNIEVPAYMSSKQTLHNHTHLYWLAQIADCASFA